MEETPPGNRALLTEIRDELIEARHASKDLREAVAVLTGRLTRSRRWVAVVVALGVLLAVVVWRNYSNLNCVRNWANDTSGRSTTLTGLANARTAAEDTLFRDAGADHPDTVKVKADYRAYLAAADKYHAAVIASPVPRSYGCRSF